MISQPDLTMDPAVYQRFTALLQRIAGIKLGPGKEDLVRARLLCRLRARNMMRFSDYLGLLSEGREPEEVEIALDLLTTNETYFFREPQHFAFLQEQAQSQARVTGRPFRVWSAACSSGEEPYSIAMTLASILPAGSFEILASDYSARVLAVAQEGLYRGEGARHIPKPHLSRFCLRGTRSAEGLFLVTPELRQHVRFQRVNLVEPLPTGGGEFDIIFLRNVLIYFETETRRKVVAQLSERLRPEGFLVVSHTESLNGVADQLRACGPSIYQRPKAATVFMSQAPRRVSP